MSVDRPLDRSPSDLTALGDVGLVIHEFRDPQPPVLARAGAVHIGIHRDGPLPRSNLDEYDILLSADEIAPRPWVGLRELAPALADLKARIELQPVAAATAAQILRASLTVSFEEALAFESLAYSMLLGSGGFHSWRAATPIRPRPDDDTPRVFSEHTEGVLHIRLHRPAKRNAFDAHMRDELYDALEYGLQDSNITKIELSGTGIAFSAGGDLNEFGRAPDIGVAHLIRMMRSPTRLVHRMRERVNARLHGACIGAGIEIPAAAAHIIAKPGAFFRLPEVSMGLIPGAGGTVTIPRRIGRQRACYMAISGADIDVPTALAWGLVDETDGG